MRERRRDENGRVKEKLRETIVAVKSLALRLYLSLCEETARLPPCFQTSHHHSY